MGTGGTTAFSTDFRTASLTVSAVNDAPVLTAGEFTLGTITEDELAAGIAGNGIEIIAGGPGSLAVDFLSSADGTGATNSVSGFEFAGAEIVWAGRKDDCYASPTPC